MKAFGIHSPNAAPYAKSGSVAFNDESERRAEHVDISDGDDESTGHEEGANDGKEGQSSDDTSDAGERRDAPRTSHGLVRRVNAAVRWQWLRVIRSQEEQVQTVNSGGTILDFGPNIYPLLWYHPDTRLRANERKRRARDLFRY